MPSLKQLNEAVTAFMQEFPDDVITVVVDATFGHRIDPSEVAEFDEAVAHNELVAPPAGAIGRGDSFILSIANKTKGSILTNDSYQEFHGQYPWVFDEGRLIGGKPVPNVGWVFVLRTPVRGPVSRKSVRAGRSVDKNTGRVPRASKEASLPMPVPKAPPPGVTVGKGARGEAAVAAKADGRQVLTASAAGRSADGGRRRGRRDGRAATDGVQVETASAGSVVDAPRPAPARDEPVNELMAFINFVEHHPVGSSVNAVVESYSSHGAYVAVGTVRGYVPLRLMSEPAARSARELGKVGDAVTLVVHSFTPARRSIDMAVPAAAVKDGITPASVPVEPHAAETAAIAEAAVIATAGDTTADAGAVALAPAPAKPARRSRKAAAAAAAGTVPESAGALEAAAAVTGMDPALLAEPTAPSTQPKPAKRAGKRGATPAVAEPVATAPVPTRARRSATRNAPSVATETPAAPAAAARPAPSKRTAKAAAQPATPPAPSKRTAKQAAATSAATVPAKKAAATAKATKKSAAKQASAAPEPAAPAVTTTPVKAIKQAPAKSVGARAAKQAPAKPASAKGAGATTAPAKKAAAKGAGATAAPAKKAAAKKSPAKKAPAKR